MFAPAPGTLALDHRGSLAQRPAGADSLTRRPLAFESTIGLEKEKNVQLRAGTTKEEFVRFRTQRDATLQPPRLLFPSVQVNVDAGRMPPPHANGKRYLMIPLNLFRAADEVGAPLPK